MRTISAGKLRSSLGEVLDLASSGERIVIERDHLPVAVLISIEESHRLDGSQDARKRQLGALDRLDGLAKRMARDFPAPDDGFPDSAAWIRWDRDHGHGDHG